MTRLATRQVIAEHGSLDAWWNQRLECVHRLQSKHYPSLPRRKDAEGKPLPWVFSSPAVWNDSASILSFNTGDEAINAFFIRGVNGVESGPVERTVDSGVKSYFIFGI